MRLQLAPGWLQPGDTWHGTAIDLWKLLQRLTDAFAERIHPDPAFLNSAVEALAYNIQHTAGDVTVLRAPHQAEHHRGHCWVHYTLRSARAMASYQLYLRIHPNDGVEFEERVYAVSRNDLRREILWTDVDQAGQSTPKRLAGSAG